MCRPVRLRTSARVYTHVHTAAVCAHMSVRWGLPHVCACTVYCIHACVCVHLCAWMCVCTQVCVYVNKCLSLMCAQARVMHVCAQVCVMHVCLYVHTSVRICKRVQACAGRVGRGCITATCRQTCARARMFFSRKIKNISFL